MALSEMEVLSAEDAERRYRANEQFAIGQEQARRRKLSDLQASPEGQTFMRQETERTEMERYLRANPGIAQQIMKKRVEESYSTPKPGPIVQAETGIYERTPRGLVRLKEPGTGVPLKPKTTGAKIPAEIQRMAIAMNSLDEGLKEYEKLLEVFNPRSPADQADPNKRARASSLIADLQLQAKEAQALGALTGPDVEILNRLLSNPASLAGAFYGKEGLREQLREAKGSISRRRTGLKMQYPEFQIPEAPPVAAAQNIFSDPDKEKRYQEWKAKQK